MTESANIHTAMNGGSGDSNGSNNGFNGTTRRTMRWRESHDRAPFAVDSEAALVRLMRERSHYDAADDAAYMRIAAARFRVLDGVVVRSDSSANFVEDLLAFGDVEAVWVDDAGRETQIPPGAYRLARLHAAGIPAPATGAPNADPENAGSDGTV